MVEWVEDWNFAKKVKSFCIICPFEFVVFIPLTQVNTSNWTVVLRNDGLGSIYKVLEIGVLTLNVYFIIKWLKVHDRCSVHWYWFGDSLLFLSLLSSLVLGFKIFMSFRFRSIYGILSLKLWFWVSLGHFGFELNEACSSNNDNLTIVRGEVKNFALKMFKLNY